ncbi:MAG: DNA/RNA nuclease SfsA [Thermosphaera sp.]
MARILKLENLLECKVKRRVNRFTVEVEVNGKTAGAHLTNTGRLSEYLVRGKRGLCALIDSPRLKYRLIAVEDQFAYAVVDTLTQQRVFEQLLAQGMIPWLSKCELFKRNFRVRGEVIDYLVKCPGISRLVELKSSVLRVQGIYASYPDCPTERGRRQINVLADVAAEYKPAVVFVAALPGVVGFKPYCSGDPFIFDVMKKATEKGVLFKAFNIYMVDETGWIVLERPDLPVVLEC